ncbi:hypothetical protein P3X46_029275 [Hevea brasiliensis]|uniref:RING-type E3 ubiquitin transferase n=1 Tax=Hevea brasiliensis TaxID=3981 RepID=A0ABQ9KSX3_HEVBR|nr:U-box domain-containing protein 5 [Hevea brasiliensis]KAJ9147072.1 hypothetical protein P3X46_029275 [Hevea brasiliensis]
MGTLPYLYSFKAHRSICTELMKLVDRIGRVFPEIEAARPRCASGIQALCLLNGTIEKARQILRYCCESSKLYLVITGDVIISRCQRSRNNFEQSLGQIQTMVPTMLAAEISQIIDDLNAATFMLDSSDEEAGKAVRELIQHGSFLSDSVAYSEMKALQVAAPRLHITSPKAILIEKRSIKKLLDKVGDTDPTKKKILKYFLYLLKKYGDLIMEEQIENPKAEHEGSVARTNSTNTSVYSQSVEEVESDIGIQQYEVQTDVLSRDTPPEEFKCPISMRLMYDPVVIASGQTFERMWIQKWFDDGNNACPKTKVKLPHCSLTPNTAMKHLISRWCEKHGVTIPDPSVQVFHSLDVSSTSITSLGSSMNDLHLPLDISNISFGSLDASYSSDSSRTRFADGSSLMLTRKTEDCLQFQSHASIIETDSEFLTRLSELNWDSQCKMVEDINSYLQYNNQSCYSMSSENFVDPLFRFLKDACEQHDARAQRAGSQLLLAFVSQNRSGLSYLHEDSFNLLVSFLDSEVTEETLAILEVLSGDPYCRTKITAAGALVPVLKILDSQSKEFQERAIKILHNLSSNCDICSQIISLECIPKLVPLINEGRIARYCMVLLKNLCETEKARIAVVETNGFISSVAELLESGSREEQEHAVAVLLSLCSQRIQYCQLVMVEGVIPSLVDISVNGNDRAKATALELLRQLRDIDHGNEQECFQSDVDTSRDGSQHTKEKKSSKTSGFFKMNLFSKPSSHASKKKR